MVEILVHKYKYNENDVNPTVLTQIPFTMPNWSNEFFKKGRLVGKVKRWQDERC